MKHYTKIYIDGDWVEPACPQTLEIVDPTTETPFATLSMGNAEDVDRAVAAARAAFPAFSSTAPAERIALLEQAIEVSKRRRDDLAAVMAQEIGCPRSATVQTDGAVGQLKQAIATLKEYSFETRIGNTVVRREAIGVCGLISPWNWPVQSPCTKLAYALAAGCTMVLKPSEYSPISAILLTEILHEAGIPKGVFNLVNGNGPVVGAAISRHPDIDMISFTGSTRTGVMVAEAAAPSVKRVVQELGGKSANIILPDADLKAAASWNVARGFFNSGQSCHAPSRILVHEKQADEVLKHLVDEAGKVRIGDPSDPTTTMGPVVNRVQFEKIQGYIEQGIAEGARPVCGGPGRPAGFNRGLFVRPTIFADVSPEMTIAREEIFGPVLAVLTYSSEDEAIEIANGTPYGLGGYLFTSSPDKARAVGRRMQAGRIFLNGAPGSAAAPMGGYKQSGNGRQMGVFGLEEYLEVKAMFGFEARSEQGLAA